MARAVEIEMELGGFRIERFKVRIRADREDIPRISSEIGRGLLNIMQPPANLIDQPEPKQITSAVLPSASGNSSSHTSGGGGRGRSRHGRSAGNGTSAAPPIEWTHDPSKWGTPKQMWTEHNKILWLLNVIARETGQSEVGGPSIADTFNNKFKQFGPLSKASIPRNMARLKTNEPALVMDNTSNSPITWYLTEEGNKAAERLVVEARTPTESTSANG